MLSLIFIIIAATLLAGFFALTRYEVRRGFRFAAPFRNTLDGALERIVFIYEHVNIAEFLRDEVRHFASRIVHGIVHYSLIAVRFVERTLTVLIRRIRTNPEIDTAPRETAREFVKTLSDFKGTLNATHPEISDIN